MTYAQEIGARFLKSMPPVSGTSVMDLTGWAKKVSLIIMQ